MGSSLTGFSAATKYKLDWILAKEVHFIKLWRTTKIDLKITAHDHRRAEKLKNSEKLGILLVSKQFELFIEYKSSEPSGIYLTELQSRKFILHSSLVDTTCRTSSIKDSRLAHNEVVNFRGVNIRTRFINKRDNTAVIGIHVPKKNTILSYSEVCSSFKTSCDQKSMFTGHAWAVFNEKQRRFKCEAFSFGAPYIECVNGRLKNWGGGCYPYSFLKQSKEQKVGIVKQKLSKSKIGKSKSKTGNSRSRPKTAKHYKKCKHRMRYGDYMLKFDSVFGKSFARCFNGFSGWRIFGNPKFLCKNGNWVHVRGTCYNKKKI